MSVSCKKLQKLLVDKDIKKNAQVKRQVSVLHLLTNCSVTAMLP